MKNTLTKRHLSSRFLRQLYDPYLLDILRLTGGTLSVEEYIILVSNFPYVFSFTILCIADAREVFNLTVDAKSIEWISLSWEAPCPNVSVAYSIDRYIGESVDQSVKIDSRIIENVTRHNATDLDPCAQYTFSVRVITEFWISDGSNVTETTDDASKSVIYLT